MAITIEEKDDKFVVMDGSLVLDKFDKVEDAELCQREWLRIDRAGELINGIVDTLIDEYDIEPDEARRLIREAAGS